MKRLRFRIAGIMLASVIILFLAFLAIFRYSFYHYYSNMAKKAIESEMDFIQNYEFSDEDEDYVNEDDLIFTEYIRYLLTDRTYSQVDKEGADFYGITGKEAERILVHVNRNLDRLKEGKVIHINDLHDHYVMGLVDYSSIDGWEGEEFSQGIIYIDIRSIMAISRQFTFAALIALVIVSILMGIIGLRLGRRLEEESARQTTFFQNASHELKTPLMSIQGYAEGIQTGVSDPQKAAAVIMDESQRMTDLVQELLDISRIESGKIRLEEEEFDLQELLYDALRSIEPLAGRENIRLEVDFPQKQIEVTGDEVQLRKAVNNLLSNALRHAQELIRISCAASAKEAVITVENDGTPLDRGMRKQVFERFYTGPNGSTGIGLALTKEIVELHKGTVSADVKNGRTVFEIRLPGQKISLS